MKRFVYLCSLVCFAASAVSCGNSGGNFSLIGKSAFDTLIDGKQVSLYTLRSGKGLTVQVTNFGARLVSVWTPDRNGIYGDVCVGYENIGKYLRNPGERYLGCVVGRYANRIAGGSFELDGNRFSTPLNNNGQTLHGGLKGFDFAVWDVVDASDSRIDFSYVSEDGDDGFPGRLNVRMSYFLDSLNRFCIIYKATTDKPTVVNLSNHAFFNLKGEGNGDILDHLLTVSASAYTPINEVLIPSGEIRDVTNTPFDFRTPVAIGERIDADDPQLKFGGGYDHNWALDGANGETVLAATVYEPASGRLLEVYADQPGIQFYSGNFFDGKGIGKHGKPIGYREAFALETQKFPDSPNHIEFPTTRLDPGDVYSHVCIYKFSTR
jgi:aldose 1-epimerase